MIRKIEMPEMDETYKSAMFAKILGNKINELCDAVNDIQKEREAERFEIQEWIGLFEEVRKSVNAHEKQIDELQMKLEPHKCETRSKNVQPGTESRSENVQELALVRKALDKGMEHITGLNNMIESWYRLINSDLGQETKLHILKSAISAYVENKGGNNEQR